MHALGFLKSLPKIIESILNDIREQIRSLIPPNSDLQEVILLHIKLVRPRNQVQHSLPSNFGRLRLGGRKEKQSRQNGEGNDPENASYVSSANDYSHLSGLMSSKDSKIA